jgi:hypothetical protein
LVRKPEGRRIDFMEIGYEVVDWIYLAQDRVQRCAVMKTVMVPLVP